MRRLQARRRVPRTTESACAARTNSNPEQYSMTISKDYLTVRELRYRIGPDANRFLRPDWRRVWRPGYENDPFYRFFERLERRYRPDQLRDDQGRFAFEGGRGTSANRTGSRQQDKVAQSISPSLRIDCDSLYLIDARICRRAGSRACYAQAALRYGNCLAGLPIPPLNY